MNILNEQAVVKTYNKFSRLPLGSVTAQGWLKEQLLRNKEGMGGHLDELEPDLLGTPFINYNTVKKHPFLGDPADPILAAGWGGELSGVYWTGLIELAFTLQDDELIAKATKWIEGVLKHQEPDGYLGSFPADLDRMVDYNAIGATWCYRAMLAFYDATGRQDVLDAVHRGLLWFCENWKDHKTDYCGCVIIEPMIVVYAYTGDERLVKFSEDWLDWLEDHTIWPNSVSQYLSDKLPYVSFHAGAYGEDSKNPALIYCATGEEKMLKASVNAFDKCLARMVQTTGGVGSSSEYLSPKGAAQETEYCNYSHFNHSYYWMAMATGEARWADEVERAIFNGAQGARKKDERAVAYFTSPNQTQASNESSIYGDWGEYGAYAPCFHVACCPTQSVRTMPEFIRSMGMTDENDDLYLFCYGPAEVKAPKIDFTMDTLYPFRDTITLHITRSEDADLRIRIPAWCKNPTVTVNGKEVKLSAIENGFTHIDATLTAGDTVVLHFPMEIKLVKVDDSHAASKFPISIERGPLVYALPIPTNWVEYPGNPITPLPEGWSWYKAYPILDTSNCDVFTAYYNASWCKAIDETLSPDAIKVTEHEPTGYVWEEPPVTIEVPLYHAKYAYMFCSPKIGETYEVPVEVEGDTTMCKMVPHGCTNLRITYLPRAAKSE